MLVVKAVGGWIIFFLILAMIARTSLGHRLMVYALYLVFTLLVLTHYKDLMQLLSPTK